VTSVKKQIVVEATQQRAFRTFTDGIDHMAAHRDRLDRFNARGTLLMAGPLLDASGRAIGVFTSRAAAEDFIRDDPFVVHGVVAKWSVVEWSEVLA
jgi:uncharacterized protein YciI